MTTSTHRNVKRNVGGDGTTPVLSVGSYKRTSSFSSDFGGKGKGLMAEARLMTRALTRYPPSITV